MADNKNKPLLKPEITFNDIIKASIKPIKKIKKKTIKKK